jgi:hypothetical protein
MNYALIALNKIGCYPRVYSPSKVAKVQKQKGPFPERGNRAGAGCNK